MAKLYGKVYGTVGLPNTGISNFLNVNDPDIIHEIFVKYFDAIPDHLNWYQGKSPKVNKILFAMPGNSDWKRIRGLLTPAFSLGKLESMRFHMTDISDKLIENLNKFEKSGRQVDFRKYIDGYTMDVIAACNFGINVDSINNPDHPIVVNVKRMFNIDPSISRIVSMVAPKVAKIFGLQFLDKSAVNFLSELTNRIIDERKSNSISNQENKRTNLIQILIDSVDRQQTEHTDNEMLKKTHLTTDEMIAQIIMFFVIGFDTTGSGITHVLYFISKHPTIQQKVYEEVKDLTDYSLENLNEMKYLSAVINETLRMKPPAPVIPRHSVKDIELSGIKIPAGTSITISPYAVHMDPDYWRDPLEFKPERFLEHDYNPRAFIPFGGGPRICIAQKFALTITMICCAKLIQRFELTLGQGFKLEYFNGSIVFLPKQLLLNIKSRIKF